MTYKIVYRLKLFLSSMSQEKIMRRILLTRWVLSQFLNKSHSMILSRCFTGKGNRYITPMMTAVKARVRSYLWFVIRMRSPLSAILKVRLNKKLSINTFNNGERNLRRQSRKTRWGPQLILMLCQVDESEIRSLWMFQMDSLRQRHMPKVDWDLYQSLHQKVMTLLTLTHKSTSHRKSTEGRSISTNQKVNTKKPKGPEQGLKGMSWWKSTDPIKETT